MFEFKKLFGGLGNGKGPKTPAESMPVDLADAPFVEGDGARNLAILEAKRVRKEAAETAEAAEAEKKKLPERAEVNGIQLQLSWDSIGGYWVLFFPQITGKGAAEAKDRGVYGDELIRLSKHRNRCMFVFCHSKKSGVKDHRCLHAFPRDE